MDEKIFEQPEETQEPSPAPAAGEEDPVEQRAEIREAEQHGEERNPPDEIPSTGSRGSWT